jgi:hypothetical protein
VRFEAAEPIVRSRAAASRRCSSPSRASRTSAWPRRARSWPKARRG